MSKSVLYCCCWSGCPLMFMPAIFLIVQLHTPVQKYVWLCAVWLEQLLLLTKTVSGVFYILLLYLLSLQTQSDFWTGQTITDHMICLGLHLINQVILNVIQNWLNQRPFLKLKTNIAWELCRRSTPALNQDVQWADCSEISVPTQKSAAAHFKCSQVNLSPWLGQAWWRYLW